MRRALLSLVLLTVSCTMGPRTAHYAPATTPTGSQVRLRGLDRRVQGELLAVDDSALTVLVLDEVWLVAYRFLTAADLQPGGGVWLGRRSPHARDRKLLRLHSRFPQGLDPALLARLLGDIGQPAIRVYTR